MATGPHLLFFTAASSGPARRMESLLAQVANRERDRLRVSHVDVDASPKLRDLFGVSEVPTLVLLVEGRLVARLVGRANAPEIDRLLAEHLSPGNPDRSLAA